ncbi:hypothetical protein K8942_05130 [Candidatus Peribacteria bacterium]|nr:MAG: hypothetical protein K8942_05130 [Candidatus Peribacteria bacterium]
MDTPYRRAIITLLKNMPDKAKPMIIQLRRALQTSEGLDKDMRLARTGAETVKDLPTARIPDGSTAEADAEPIAEAFALHNQNKIEPLRQVLIALIREALQEKKAATN